MLCCFAQQLQAARLVRRNITNMQDNLVRFGLNPAASLKKTFIIVVSLECDLNLEGFLCCCFCLLLSLQLNNRLMLMFFCVFCYAHCSVLNVLCSGVLCLCMIEFIHFSVFVIHHLIYLSQLNKIASKQSYDDGDWCDFQNLTFVSFLF